MPVNRTAAFAVTVVLLAAVSLVPGHSFAQSANPERGARGLEAHAQTEPKRAPTRIRVTPRCLYRTQTLTYPPPYECEAPGPGYVRQCESWLATEARPSGTVIVPHTRCRWERG